MKKAVLFLIFNRPDVTKEVFEQICLVKPPRLYIASDGPRKERVGEEGVIEKLREDVLAMIDWDCEVKTLFRDENLGCRKSVSSAITWFFEHEEDGIILEDDCLPHPSFFTFCENLLDHYKDDKRVMHISGDQFISDFDNGASYYFAKVQHCWGWATWADRWRYYGSDLKEYSEKNLKKFSSSANVQVYWGDILKKMKDGEIDSWAYQWAFKIVENDGLCINPVKNLISNIGFDIDATHTSDQNHPCANMQTYSIEKIIHPQKVIIDENAVAEIYEKHFNINLNDSNMDSNFANMKGHIKGGVKNLFKKIFGKREMMSEEELLFEKYRAKERFVEEIVRFRGCDLVVPDVVSFAYQIREIFMSDIYRFTSKKDAPVIYDCGANIGMSVIYFKELFPQAMIRAYEADEKIFSALKKNTEHLTGVELYQSAVWINDDELTFSSEGADGGSVVGDFDEKQKVPAVRLRDVLKGEEVVDFLKMDVEGAEVDVIKDCDGALDNVDRIFVEYHSFKNSEQYLDEILRVLRDAGFRYYVETIKRPCNPYMSINDDSHSMDLQVNIFGMKKELLKDNG